MTAIFGPDISSFEHGLNVAALHEPFVLLKATEGTYYTDADYPTWLAQARSSGKTVVAYHFISGEDPNAQAAHLADKIIDKSVPVMIDWEPEGNYKPTFPQLIALADAINNHGMRVKLAYCPRWHWLNVGSPNLTPLTARGIGLVSSAYPNTAIHDPATDYAADGGDDGPGWNPYGGVTPIIWQYTDSGYDQQNIDFNAYKGTITQLNTFLGTTTTTGDTMGTYTMSDGWQKDYPDVAAALNQHIPVNTVVDETQAAAYAMIRSFVAAERLAAVESKLDQILSTQTAPAPVNVDTTALASVVAKAVADELDRRLSS